MLHVKPFTISPLLCTSTIAAPYGTTRGKHLAFRAIVCYKEFIYISALITGTRAGEITTSIESAIRGGGLEPGQGLPPVRELAARLGVSPTTVAMAYRSLQQRGLITTSGRRGTRVASRPVLNSRTPVSVPAGVRNLASGNPDPALLPDLRPHLAGLKPEPRLYGEAANRSDLLDLAAAGFARDGIPGDFLAVTGGALDAIERVLGAHLLPGDRVVVEDPGYPAQADLLAALGLVPEPVPVDELGPQPEEFAQALRQAAACIVTPRAQNPFGSALDRGRLAQLRVELDRLPGLLVIEDDHAGSIAGAPAFSLCAGGRERWAVVRSVSKSLGPDLRLAIMAGDATTVSRLEARQQIGAGWVSHVLQGLVVALWRDHGVEELLERATTAYEARRLELIASLDKHGIAAQGRSGLNVWIPVEDEQATARRLLDAGWAVALGERFRFRTAPAVRVSIGSLRPGESLPLAEVLARPAARGPQPHTRSA